MNMHNKLPDPQAADLYSFPAPAATTRRPRWLVPVAIALVIVAAVFAYRTFFAPAPAAAPAPVAAQVTVVVPGTRSVTDAVTATGSIAARRDSAIGVQGEGGRVIAVLVEPGQSVAAGQVLARIDRAVPVQTSAQLRASIRSAEADARLADADLKRAQALVAKGFISKADIDRRTATRDGALARTELARAQLAANEALIARLDVRAPAAGLVLSRAVETGQIVNSGSAMFRIAEGGILEMRALVAEQDMARLKPGMPARVTPIGSTTSYPGKIWLLDPVIDAVSRQGVARIAVPYAPGLRVGAFAKTAIDAGEAMRPVLPQSAIQADDKGNFVMVVGADNKVQRRAVTVGTVSNDGVSINAGITGTEKVVANAGAFLRPGEKVAPILARTPG
ncbi:efflux RND transporter periplasmic adaptor subunit [Sandarakinorhabdus sp. DWP1-3-1]|uniref:efflux RND transporter periplasmic adaptor subunit n=1 Tax=Sandarakinorhabdus sp. DWP1-3-1 TaxID=2804627 RepID=UPI003CF743D6